MICPQCREIVQDDKIFCYRCGAIVSPDSLLKTVAPSISLRSRRKGLWIISIAGLLSSLGLIGWNYISAKNTIPQAPVSNIVLSEPKNASLSVESSTFESGLTRPSALDAVPDAMTSRSPAKKTEQRPEGTNLKLLAASESQPDVIRATEEASEATQQVNSSPVNSSSAVKEQLVVIPAGTVLVVRLIDNISSDSNRFGDKFRASLVHALVIDDFEVAPAGALVEGMVSGNQMAGRVHGTSLIILRLIALHSKNGEVIPIETEPYYRQAPKTIARDAKKIGILTGVGAAIGVIAGGAQGAAIGAALGAGAGTATTLVTRGEAVKLPSETPIKFHLRKSVIYKYQMNQ